MAGTVALVTPIIVGALNAPQLRAQDPVDRQRTTGPRPAFDAAEVQISKPKPLRHMRGGVLRDGRLSIREATMVDLIRTAWTIDPERIAGGPSWLEMDRFDINAKAPANTPPELMFFLWSKANQSSGRPRTLLTPAAMIERQMSPPARRRTSSSSVETAPWSSWPPTWASWRATVSVARWSIGPA
jgi:hypothetical protein